MDPCQAAEAMWSVYDRGYAFPVWSLQMLKSGKLDNLLKETTVYYKACDSFADVQRVATEREPVNIGMWRFYNKQELNTLFGYRRGAYAESSRAALMPNIAIYCRTPMRGFGPAIEVHVINVVGYAFDSMWQPDYAYFFRNKCSISRRMWNELVERMRQVWCFVFECARRHGLQRVFLANVGGGAFSYYLSGSYDMLREASLTPVLQEYPEIEARHLPRMPDFVFSNEGRPLLANSLFVNAWDPWSMVGNGNEADNSLDGVFGRNTAMALLCWPKSNPQMRWESVLPAGGEQ